MIIPPDTAVIEPSEPSAGALVLTLTGRLDARGAAGIWERSVNLVTRTGVRSLTIDLAGVDYLDAAGAVLVSALKQNWANNDPETISVLGLSREAERLIAMADTTAVEPSSLHGLTTPLSFVEGIGNRTREQLETAAEFIAFAGDITRALGKALVRPGKIRWKDALVAAEKAGVNALPIVALISFIVGLVMAFQAAMPMKMFGAEIYVANLIGIAMVRELGPLMTAIILAGRSGSAFAAEIGTMKISEEIDALATMGLDPVMFLMVPRILAAVFITPLLTVFSNFIGVAGGSIVLISLGYPAATYYRQIINFVTWIDFAGGLAKCFVFGILIAATGCIRGFQARSGPSAVGTATTSAVVTGIILIAVVDGIFSVLYYCLGI